jgi:hypothetical protein
MRTAIVGLNPIQAVVSWGGEAEVEHELELDLIMDRNPPTTGTFKALPGNIGS